MAEPGRIEVQLSLLSAEDSAAAKDLARSLKEVADSFKWLKSADYKQSAENLSRLYETIQKRHDELTQTILKAAPGSQGGPSRMPASPFSYPPQFQPAHTYSEEAKEKQKQEERERRAEAHRQNTSQVETEKQRRRRIQQEQEEEDARREKLKSDLRAAQEGRRASEEGRQQLYQDRTTGDAQRKIDAWVEKSGVGYGTGDTGGVDLESSAFRIPRFGRLNIQDVLNRLRDSRLRRIRDAGDPENENRFISDEAGRREVQERFANQATAIQKWSNRAGNAYLALTVARGLSNFLSSQAMNPLEFADQGAQLGYARTGGLDLFGFQTGLGSAAGTEGRRQAADALGMRMRAGINMGQAQSITHAVAGAGFSGNLGSSIRMDLMAPLFQRYGMNPEEITPLLQVLKTGTANIQDLNKVLGDMGEVARSANLTLAEYNQNLAGSVQATQALGGSAISGAQYGRQFMMGTGLPSSVGDQLSQNPFIQSVIASQTNVNPMAQGALPAAVRLQATNVGLNQLTQMFTRSMGPAQNQRYQITDPDTGQVVGTQSSGNLGIGAAANYLGVTPDQLQKMLGSEQEQARVEAFQVRADRYSQRVGKRLDDPQLSKQRRDAILNDYTKSKEGWFHRHTGWDPFGDDPGPGTYKWNEKGEIVDTRTNRVVQTRGQVHQQAEQWAAQQDKGNKAKEFGQLRGAAHRLGVDQSEIDKVKKGDVQGLRRLVSEASREAEASYQIAMTPLTKKFFKVLANDQGTNVDWNADSRNTSSAIPPGPAPLSPQTNTGAGPIVGPG